MVGKQESFVEAPTVACYYLYTCTRGTVVQTPQTQKEKTFCRRSLQEFAGGSDPAFAFFYLFLQVWIHRCLKTQLYRWLLQLETWRTWIHLIGYRDTGKYSVKHSVMIKFSCSYSESNQFTGLSFPLVHYLISVGFN